MTTILDDTMNAAKHVMDGARENAGQAMSTAKHGAGHAVASTRSTVMDGIRVVSGLLATLRGLDANDALGWVGLSRRPSPLRSLAIFGAGVAVGTGVGMLVAPMSGAKLRGMILGQLRGAKEEVEGSLEEAGAAAKDLGKKVEGKVESVAGEAADAARQAGRKLEHKVEAAKETVVHQVSGAVGQIADEVKMSAAKPPRPAGGTSRQPS